MSLMEEVCWCQKTERHVTYGPTSYWYACLLVVHPLDGSHVCSESRFAFVCQKDE